MPEDLLVILDGLGKAETEARQLVEGLTDAQLKQVGRLFRASHREVWSLITECSGTDVNRVRFKGPFVVVLRLTVGTGFLVMTALERAIFGKRSRCVR